MPKKNSKTKKKSPPKKKKRSVIKNRKEPLILLAIAVFSLLLWDTAIIYPVKLLVVALHEISHAIVTIFTGGSVIGMNVNSGLYGEVNSEGGNEFLIASAGYLGSLIFGYLIFVSAENKKHNLILSTFLSVILLLFVANFFTDAISIFILLIYAIFFYVSPRYFPTKINYWAMRTLGLLSSLYVIFDIKEDLLTTDYLGTDADRLAIITTVPAIYWGLLWFAFSIALIYYMISKTYFPKK